MEVGDLNKLMMVRGAKPMNTIGRDKTVLRETVYRHTFERDGEETIFIRVWVETILNASEKDVEEKRDTLIREINQICREELEGPKIALRILDISLVNAVEVYTDPDVGVVLYKDWP